MITEFPNRISFFAPHGPPVWPHRFPQRTGPAVVVGIQRDLCPPLTFGRAHLHRMRIVVVEPPHPAGSVEIDASNDLDEHAFAEVLPILSPASNRGRSVPFPPRPVLGEILRGENGAFYERLGHQIRPLHRLVSGPSGEVLEVQGGVDASPRKQARVRALPPIGPALELNPDGAIAGSDPASARVSSAPVNPSDRPSAPEASFRPLFPEPGVWRVVRLGDFKSLLAPQLVHPERLRDTHRLPCYVQVFEAALPHRIETLAEAIYGEAEAISQLQPLTPAVLQQLQLAPLLPALHRPQRPHTRPPGLLLPYDRVFCLEVANDLTAETPSNESGNLARKSEQVRGRPDSEARTADPAATNQQGAIPQSSLAQAAARETGPRPSVGHAGGRDELAARAATLSPTDPPPAASSSPGALKTSIPTQFLSPWELRFSREEALFAVIRGGSFLGRLRAGLLRLTSGPLFSSDFRRWLVLLNGRNPDEQLWAVRPPKSAFAHPSIRAWAQRTLEKAGYDPCAMLLEWEIFWRRKGV